MVDIAESIQLGIDTLNGLDWYFQVLICIGVSILAIYCLRRFVLASGFVSLCVFGMLFAVILLFAHCSRKTRTRLKHYKNQLILMFFLLIAGIVVFHLYLNLYPSLLASL